MNATWLDRNRHFIFFSLLLVALGGIGIFYLYQPAPGPIELLPPGSSPNPTPPPAISTPAPLRIYVTGAVRNPDVYFLAPGSIVKDAIQAAGGFSAEADRETINLAIELKDQQHVRAPRRGEVGQPPPDPVGQPEGGAATLINLNTATQEQLNTLPGIGPAIAQRIIDYREKSGGFSTVEQLTEVSGIGPTTFLKIKELVTVK